MNRVPFTAGNVFVFADPYLKLMDGESDKCVGYMPKKATENLIDIIGSNAKAHPDYVQSWFDGKANRHFIGLSWSDTASREKFNTEFWLIPESERCGIVRDAECVILDASVAEDLNEKYRQEEEARSAERKAWFSEEGNAEAVKRVAVLKGTSVVDEKTGRMRIDPEEAQFLEGIIRFMSKSDQPEDVAFLGHDEDGKCWIAYSFRLETLKREFERRVNCSAKKPEGIGFANEGPLWEELVMGICNRKTEKKASDPVAVQISSSGEGAADGQTDTVETGEAVVVDPDAAIDPTEEFEASAPDGAV